MRFLLDTDICSAQMKGNARVHGRFIQYGGHLHMSTVTLAELYGWTLRAKASPKRMESLVELLREVQVMALDHGIASPDLDLLNAAVALVHDLTLVTHNVQDYANVPGLTVVDWLAT